MSKRITEKQRKTLPRRAQDLSKEELLLALKKKKECNAKALEIVEGLIEPNVSEGWFLDVLKHINQSHLQDVTEERALSRLCGYPLCSNVISSITSQQYRISTKLNKVYDIQERKNFCCNRCFKACKFIKDQMYISPLWLRDVEPSIQFVLLPSSDLRGCSGDEVNVQVERITRQEVNNLSKDKSLNFKDEEVETHREEKSLEDLLHSLKQIESIQESNLKDVLLAESSHGHNNHCEVTDTIENTILIEEQSAVSSEDQKDPLSCVKDSERCNSNEKIVKHEGNIAVLQCKEEDTKSLPEAQMADSHLDKGVHDSKECSDKKDVSWNEKSSNNSRCEKNDGKQLEILMLASICETDSSKTSPIVTDDNRFCSGNVICSPAETRDTSQEDLKVETNLPSSCSSSYFTSITEYQPNCTSDKVVSTGCNNHFLSGNQCSTPTHRMKGELEKIQSKAKLLPSNEKFSQTVARVEKCLQDWFTMETMIYLYGEQALKDMLKLKGECIQAHYKALSSITWDPEKQERFLTICKRLNLIEIQESGYDIQVTRDSLDTKRKPLPNYDALKKEAESIELKVNAFYLGKMEINERKVSFAKDVKAESSVGDDYEPQLPLVHLHSQRTLRKRIVLDGLNRVLPDFLRTLGMRPSVLSSSVRNLISTFALSPTNITFKPQEWSLLGLVVIKILSLREPELKLCLHQEQSNTYLTLILMSYNLEPGYLDQLLSWLTDIDNLLQKSSGSKA